MELDSSFAAHWREQGLDVLEVIEADALALDWRELKLAPQTLLVSNLPYQISSSLVIERSIDPAGVSRMILMFQKEVAQRLVAKARTKEYGLLTVIAQSFWDVRFVLEAGPGDFYPPPNVASRVLMFTRREPEDGLDSQGFLRFAKAGFAHRRKLLARNLMDGWFSGDKTKLSEIEVALQEIGKGPQARAEELDPAQFQRLYSRLSKGIPIGESSRN
jgi:16S rRNA (adenine1518-N6/adenine1519-N6)-dimethyltransferase